MSMMTMVTRIIPSSASPDSYEALPHVSDLCGGSEIHVTSFTESKTGVSYRIETAFVELKVPQDSIKEMQKQLADHCETIRGMTCIKRNGLENVEDSPLEKSLSREGNSPPINLRDVEINALSSNKQNVEILRCSVEKNVLLLSIANSIPKAICGRGEVENTYNMTSREEKESRVLNFSSVQTEFANSKINCSTNNSMIATEIQTIPRVQDIHHSLSLARSSEFSQGNSNQANIWKHFDNLQRDNKILVINNKINILEVPKDNLISEDSCSLREIENGDKTANVKSEMFELMKKFVDNKCLICGFASSGKSSRHGKNHMLVHAKQRPFKCQKCDKAFVCKRLLESHEIIHENKLPFSCKHCDKRFRRVGTLKQHEVLHTKTLQHKCDVCNKEFASRTSLKRHLRSHTGEKPFACNICDKAYSERNRLKAHIMWHSEDKPHKCEDCGKSFKFLQYLRVHRIMHQDNKKYQCNICQQKFNFFSNLAQHKLTHSENRDHYCDRCDKKFKRPHHLRQHLATHSQKS